MVLSTRWLIKKSWALQMLTHLLFITTLKIGSSINLILQMGELKPRGAKQLVQGHIALWTQAVWCQSAWLNQLSPHFCFAFLVVLCLLCFMFVFQNGLWILKERITFNLISFFPTLCSVQDWSSLTKDWTLAVGGGVLTAGLLGISLNFFYFNLF